MQIGKTFNIPSVVCGETVFSWAARGLSLRYIESPHLFRNIINKLFTFSGGAFEYTPNWFLERSDEEFGRSSTLMCLASELYGTTLSMCYRYFGSDSHLLTILPFRTLACEDCLATSVQLKGFPVWHKEWCYVTAAYCSLHLRELRSPSNLPPVERRMWDCYLNSLQRGRQAVTLDNKRVALMVLRGRSWFVRASSYNQVISDALLKLYSLLLSRRTLWAPEGIAGAGFGQPQRLICRQELGLFERLEYGLHSSDGLQRGGALVLIGWLAGIYTEQDIIRIRGCDKRYRCSLPDNPKLLGIIALLVCTSKEERTYISNALSPLRELRLARFDAFLEGVCVAATSR